MKATRLIPILFAILFAGCASYPPTAYNVDPLKAEVMDTERAFARTMAARDLSGFSTFLADDVVFFDELAALRGKHQVVDGWEPYFVDPVAPFMWEPRQVEVLQSGTLALSSGPVWDRQGRQIATYNSVWRREEPGVWRIVFDKGNKMTDLD